MAATVSYSKEKIALLDPKTCVISQLNARQNDNRDQDVIARLAESIRTSGQEQPGLARKISGNRYEILVGGNRLEAVRLLNKSLANNESPYSFKAVVIDVDDQTALIKSIAENEFRQAMTLADRAEAMKRLSDMGLKNVEIAAHFGVDKAEVTQAMKFFLLPKKVQKSIAKGQVPEKTALVLAALAEDKAEAEKIFDQAVEIQTWTDEQLSASAEEINTLEEEGETNGEEAEGEEAETPAPAKGKKAAPKTKGRKEGSSHKKGQVGTKAVVEAAKKVGSEKTKAKATEMEEGKKRTYKQFEKVLEAIAQDKECPKPVKELIGKLEQWFYQEASDLQLKNALYKSCGGGQ